MPFIKLSDELYVNSDHVIAVRFITRTQVLLCYERSAGIVITPEQAAYFLMEVEARAALASKDETPETPSLKTRIAQALRYDFPQGVTISQLLSLPLFADSTDSEVASALLELQQEGVAINPPDIGAWFHAANVTQSPDLSDADADSLLHPEDDSAHSSDR